VQSIYGYFPTLVPILVLNLNLTIINKNKLKKKDLKMQAINRSEKFRLEFFNFLIFTSHPRYTDLETQITNTTNSTIQSFSLQPLFKNLKNNSESCLPSSL